MGLGMRAIWLLVPLCCLSQAQSAPRMDESVDLRDLPDNPLASHTSALEIESATSVCNDHSRPSGEDVDTVLTRLESGVFRALLGDGWLAGPIWVGWPVPRRASALREEVGTTLGVRERRGETVGTSDGPPDTPVG